jgi:site-specific DNA recombinase
VQTVTAGEIDLSTSTGRAVARTVGAWARQESEHKSERIRAQKHLARKRGAFTGGPVPFGWRRGGVKGAVPEIDRTAAREVKKASQRVAAGVPLARIADDWNARGIRTARGGEWDFTTVRQVLSNSKNAGFYSKDGETLGRSPLPPIISEDLYRAVMAVLRDRRQSRSFGVRWLLGGIATCGACGKPVRSAKADGRFLYRCSTPGPGHVARAAEPADLYVKTILAGRLAQPDLAGLLAPAPEHVDVDAVRADLVGWRARLDDLADSYADGAVTRAQLERGSANLRERITAAEAALAAQFSGSPLTGVLDQPDPAAAFWGADVPTQRAVLRELAAVTLLPATQHGPLPDETLLTPDGPVEVRLDPHTVTIDWKRS